MVVITFHIGISEAAFWFGWPEPLFCFIRYIRQYNEIYKLFVAEVINWFYVKKKNHANFHKTNNNQKEVLSEILKEMYSFIFIYTFSYNVFYEAYPYSNINGLLLLH